MPKVYSYRCKSCHKYGEFTTNETRRCDCGDVMRREFHIAIKRSFQPHYNHSVGAYVKNEREFRDKLKQASHVATEKTGIEHNYSPIDLGDKSSMSEDGQEAIEKANRTRGWDVGKKHFT